MIVFDEAAKYAPARAKDDDVTALWETLGRYAKETRKYGVGWFYVLQEPRDLNPDVWAQLSSGFRAIGYGLGGPSLDLVHQHVDDDPLKLYRSFPQPQASGQRPFMVMGAVSPLSFTRAPVFLDVTRDRTEFVKANASWLPGDVVRDPSSVRPEAGTTARPSRHSRVPAGRGARRRPAFLRLVHAHTARPFQAERPVIGVPRR